MILATFWFCRRYLVAPRLVFFGPGAVRTLKAFIHGEHAPKQRELVQEGLGYKLRGLLVRCENPRNNQFWFSRLGTSYPLCVREES